MYEHVTRFIDDIERIGFDRAGSLDSELIHAMYCPEIVDKNYRETLDSRGLEGTRPWFANVESLDLETTVALLTWVHRADHFNEGTMSRCLENGFVYRILRRLAELDGTWKRPNVVTFYHEYEKDGYLSNWYESAPFTYGGRTFATSEHWMMWQKACVFGDWNIADQVLKVPACDQDKVKSLGKQVKGYSDEVWDAVNLQLMRVGLRQKFVQNERLLNDLLGTGSAVLGEAAGTKDVKWGVGFDKHSPKLADPASWYGKSLLGRTLMDVRSELRQLCAMDGCPEWPVDTLRESQVWGMNLLELSRVPSTRSFALMYATIVAKQRPTVFSDARDVLRKFRASIYKIDESMRSGAGLVLPVIGWYELLDELALQVRLGKL